MERNTIVYNLSGAWAWYQNSFQHLFDQAVIVHVGQHMKGRREQGIQSAAFFAVLTEG